MILHDQRTRRVGGEARVAEDLPLSALDVDLHEVRRCDRPHHVALRDDNSPRGGIVACVDHVRGGAEPTGEVNLVISRPGGCRDKAPAMTEAIERDRALVHGGVRCVRLIADDLRTRPARDRQHPEHADVGSEVEDRARFADRPRDVRRRVIPAVVEDLGERCSVGGLVAYSNVESILPQAVSAYSARSQQLAGEEPRRLAHQTRADHPRCRRHDGPATSHALERAVHLLRRISRISRCSGLAIGRSATNASILARRCLWI